ncbi:MAG: hypothetical protein WC325_09600 [Candidatus Bathyarchaeia archaeon]|jgi:hypothetical protein
MKKPLITIKNWNEGISNSPLGLFPKMVGMDVDYLSGVARPNPKPQKVSGTVMTKLALWFTRGTTNYLAVCDLQIAKSTDATTWTDLTGFGAGAILGAAYWKGFHIVTHAANVDAFDDNATWSNAFTTFSTSYSTTNVPMFASADGKLYFGRGNVVGIITENTTFAPGTGASFTRTDVGLTLPTGTVIQDIADLGSLLMLMTNNGIYTWDRSSATYDLPIDAGASVRCGKTINNILFYISSRSTNTGVTSINATNGSTAKLIMEIPGYVIDYKGGYGSYAIPQHGGLIFQNNKIKFATNFGVFSYDIIKGTLIVDAFSSNGELADGASPYLTTGGLFAIDDTNYILGWQLNTTYGIDKTSYPNSATLAYTAYADTGVYSIGSEYETATIGETEVVLYKPLTTRGGVKVQYRTNPSASWTDIGEVNYSTHANKLTCKIQKTIPDLVNIQFRGLIDTNSNATHLKEIRIYGQ